MKTVSKKRVLSKIIFLVLICLASGATLLALAQPGIYMSMDPPADVDKSGIPDDNSCYLATASNMLAAAGYGDGDTLQERADAIYGEMTAQFGTTNHGWTDTALTWWLNSSNNKWPQNTYTVVTVLGNKSPKLPWANANGARDIGNELRNGVPVGLSISWPTNAPGVVGSGGHIITAWGDDGTDASLTANPAQVAVTDSDTDTGGDTQLYNYDAFTNPNPGGANEGNGWYINYDPNHPYIKHIVTLSPTDDPTDNKLTQKVVGSYKVLQMKEEAATDLHYEVRTDVTVLRYRTTVDWPTNNPPKITEYDPRTGISVDWDFSDNPIPQGTQVTITTEFILPTWNSISYDDIYFTYPDFAFDLTPITWVMITPELAEAEYIPNVTGGYVVGSFDLIDPELPQGENVVAEYRFIHEYDFFQSPESHMFELSGIREYTVTNLRFGHTYGDLDVEMLWQFEDWMTEVSEEFIVNGEIVGITLDWAGRLPYPEGEDITGRLPEIEQGLAGE
jgi:hypothetical protein